MTRRHRGQSDAGFTLPELMIAMVVIALIVPMIGLAITTTLRNTADVTTRADSAVAVQGLTTWLPPDVDSAEPGQFDHSPSRASGCDGTDPGNNMLWLGWTETFRGVETHYVANYRFVIDGDVAEIVRVSCAGVFSLGTGQQLKMTAKLSPTVPVITDHVNADGKVAQITVTLYTLSGEQIVIEAATKNPAETLPPDSTFTTTTTSTTTTTTTTTVAPNLPPIATPMHVTVNAGVALTFNLQATDPEHGALTAVVSGTPGAWTLVVAGTSVTVTAVGTPGVANLTYRVTDPAGAMSAITALDVEITASPTTTTTSTTSTTTTTTTSTTTTTVPPCVVGTITVNSSPVQLQNKNSGKLKNDVIVTISGLSGYCVGLTLQYLTGAPNGEYVQNFGTSAPYTVTLKGHPSGTELWTPGTKTLEVRDGSKTLLKTAPLVVTN